MNFLYNRDTYIGPGHPDHKNTNSRFRMPEFGKWDSDLAFTEVDDSYFWKQFFLYPCRVSTPVQMENIENGVWVNLRGFYVDDDGSWLFVVTPYSTFGSSKDSKWKLDKTRYFKYQACKHEFTGRSVGRCITEYTCKKCGFVQVVDSSD